VLSGSGRRRSRTLADFGRASFGCQRSLPAAAWKDTHTTLKGRKNGSSLQPAVESGPQVQFMVIELAPTRPDRRAEARRPDANAGSTPVSVSAMRWSHFLWAACEKRTRAPHRAKWRRKRPPLSSFSRAPSNLRERINYVLCEVPIRPSKMHLW
jgi:hypothetical protein